MGKLEVQRWEEAARGRRRSEKRLFQAQKASSSSSHSWDWKGRWWSSEWGCGLSGWVRWPLSEPLASPTSVQAHPLLGLHWTVPGRVRSGWSSGEGLVTGVSESSNGTSATLHLETSSARARSESINRNCVHVNSLGY